MAKKVPIHISEEWLKEIDELAGLLGMSPKVYGYIPKTLRFSITYALASIKNAEKSIPDLKPAEMDFFVTSIRKAREKRIATENAAKAAAEANKV